MPEQRRNPSLHLINETHLPDLHFGEPYPAKPACSPPSRSRDGEQAVKDHDRMWMLEKHPDFSGDEAKEVCAGCPIIDHCRDEAMAEDEGKAQHEIVGVRGGMTPAERWEVLRAAGRRKINRGRHNAGKTHCPRGHALQGANLVPSALRRGARQCQVCVRAHSAYRKSKSLSSLDEAIRHQMIRTDDEGLAVALAARGEAA